MSMKKVGALILASILVLISAVLCFMGWRLVSSGFPLFIGVGVGLFMLAAVTFWYLYHELNMAWNIEKLTQTSLKNRASAAEGLPGEQVTDIDGFNQLRHQVQAEPDDWQTWLNLGYAYAQVGDKKNGRRAFTQAIKRYRKKH